MVFDLKAETTFAQINTKTQTDGAIAAMALANGFAVATRNVADFANTGVKIINPWDI